MRLGLRLGLGLGFELGLGGWDGQPEATATAEVDKCEFPRYYMCTR